MTVMKFAAMAIVGASTIMISAPAISGPPAGFKHPIGVIHPENDFASRRSGGLMMEYLFRKDWQAPPQSYGAALSFANCLHNFDPAAAEANLRRPVADPKVRPELQYLVRRHKACATEQVMVAPLLLRVAFAEIALRSMPSIPAARGAAQSRPSTGVPERIGTFPVAAIARCQVETAPLAVSQLLRTKPGGLAEEAATEALFAATPQCVAQGRGSITPTAARMALVDAAFRGVAQ